MAQGNESVLPRQETAADPRHRWFAAWRGGTSPSDRRTFVSLVVQSIVNAFVYSTYLARLPDIRDQAHISIGTLGIVMTVGNLAGFAGSFFSTSVVGRLGSKRVTMWCGVLYVFALPIIGSSSSAVPLVSAIVGMMLMNVFLDVGVAMQSTQFSRRRTVPVMSRLSGFYSLGTFAGGAAASWIASAGFDVTVHLWVLAAVLAVGLVFVGPGLLPVDDRPDEPSPDEAGKSRWRPGRAVLILGLASAMAVPLDIVPGEWATFRMRDDLGTSTALAAAAYFMFAAGMAVGRLSGDTAAVRVGRLKLAGLGPVMSVAGLVTAATVPSRPVVLGGFLVAGLGIAAVSPLLTEAALRVPGPPGAGFRALFVGNRLAGMLTPVAVGSLAATSVLNVGNSMIIVVVPAATLLIVFAMMSIRRR